jgi:phage/plasmid-like protein (TIGR03299 family)
MGHAIEINEDGTARMAYADREIPWHRLGVPMKGLQTAEAMLQAAQADYEVIITRVAACDDNGQPIFNPNGTLSVIDDSRATLRVNKDGSYTGLATVGTRYVVQQNNECLDYALAIVGASKGDAVVDTCGVLNGGREFFASIDLGALVIDPSGVNDRIDRYVLVSNGHDGKAPISFANTSIRAVCKNTVVMGLSSARRVFTARHTRNAERAIEEKASIVLDISSDWAKRFSRMAEQLLSVNVPSSSRVLDEALNVAFPLEKDATDRQKKNRDNVVALVRGIYENNNNAAKYGHNGWSTYNAIGEYLDHYREATLTERAMASMNSNSWVSRTKLNVQDYLLSQV